MRHKAPVGCRCRPPAAHAGGPPAAARQCRERVRDPDKGLASYPGPWDQRPGRRWPAGSSPSVAWAMRLQTGTGLLGGYTAEWAPVRMARLVRGSPGTMAATGLARPCRRHARCLPGSASATSACAQARMQPNPSNPHRSQPAETPPPVQAPPPRVTPTPAAGPQAQAGCPLSQRWCPQAEALQPGASRAATRVWAAARAAPATALTPRPVSPAQGAAIAWRSSHEGSAAGVASTASGDRPVGHARV